MVTKRFLRNISRNRVETTYNHKKYVIKPKGTLVLEDGGQDEFAADYLLQTFGFLVDITKQFEIVPEKKEVRKSFGIRKGGVIK